MAVYSLADYLIFGKYKGRSIQVIIETDPQYLQWCVDNIPDFTLDGQTKKILQENLREAHEAFKKIY